MGMAEKTILIVDDDIDMSWFLQEILGEFGYDFQVASSGKDALNQMKNSIFDLILLDIKLPDMSGMNVLKELRKFTKNVPVIIVTSYGTEKLRKEADDLEVVGFLNKPFDVEKIKAITGKILQGRK